MLSIYKITNTRNSWVYIGMTTREPEKRWREHLRSAKKIDRRLYRAMRKHGIENFDMQVIASIEELRDDGVIFDLEKSYISSYNSYWFGYNDTVGGRGYRFNRPKRGRKSS